MMRTLSLPQRLLVVQLCLSTALAIRWSGGPWVSLAAVTASTSSTAKSISSSSSSSTSNGDSSRKTPWWKGLDLGDPLDDSSKKRKLESSKRKDSKSKEHYKISEEEDTDDDIAEEEEEEEAEEMFSAEDVLSPLQLEPLLQIPCSLELVPHGDDKKSSNNHHPNQKYPVQTYCDTGAQRTVLSWEAAQRLGVAHLIDRRYKGHATGVGLCRVVGRIPAHAVRLHFSSLDDNDNNNELVVTMPAITILESTGTPGVELLLGLDFLRDTQAVIDLQQEELRLISCGRNTNQRPSTQARIPFLRPRSSSSSLDLDNTLSDKGHHHKHHHHDKHKQCRSDHHRHSPKDHHQEEKDHSYLEEDDNSEYESEDPDEEVDMSWL